MNMFHYTLNDSPQPHLDFAVRGIMERDREERGGEKKEVQGSEEMERVESAYSITQVKSNDGKHDEPFGLLKTNSEAVSVVTKSMVVPTR